MSRTERTVSRWPLAFFFNDINTRYRVIYFTLCTFLTIILLWLRVITYNVSLMAASCARLSLQNKHTESTAYYYFDGTRLFLGRIRRDAVILDVAKLINGERVTRAENTDRLLRRCRGFARKKKQDAVDSYHSIYIDTCSHPRRTPWRSWPFSLFPIDARDTHNTYTHSVHIYPTDREGERERREEKTLQWTECTRIDTRRALGRNVFCRIIGFNVAFESTMLQRWRRWERDGPFDVCYDLMIMTICHNNNDVNDDDDLMIMMTQWHSVR